MSREEALENVAKLESVKSEKPGTVVLPRETCLELDNLRLKGQAMSMEHAIRMADLRAAGEQLAAKIKAEYGIDISDRSCHIDLQSGICTKATEGPP